MSDTRGSAAAAGGRSVRSAPWIRTVVRSLGWAAAIPLGALAVWLGVDAVSFSREVRDAESARPVSMTVDLATAGQTRAPFGQTHDFTCKQVFEIEADGGLSAEELAQLRGVAGTVSVVDGRGEQVKSVRIGQSDNGIDRVPPPGLVRMNPVGKGSYTLVLEISEPMEAMRGRAVRVVGRYEFCGLEYMARDFSWVVTVATGAPATALVVALVATRRRSGPRPGRCQGLLNFAIRGRL